MVKVEFTFEDGDKKKLEGDAIFGVSIKDGAYTFFGDGAVSIDEAISAITNMIDLVDDSLEMGGELKRVIAHSCLLSDTDAD